MQFVAALFVKGPIDKSRLAWVMAWHHTGGKAVPELMMTQFTEAYMHD